MEQYPYAVSMSTPPPRRVAQQESSQTILAPFYGSGQTAPQYDPPSHPPDYASQLASGVVPEQPQPVRGASLGYAAAEQVEADTGRLTSSFLQRPLWYER